MGLTLPGHLTEAMGMMGAQFPGTDESALTELASQWKQMANLCRTAKDELSSAVSHVEGANDGPAVHAFSSYMAGQSNVTGTEALSSAAQAAAAGHARAAALVMQLKVATIAEAQTVQNLITAARNVSGITQTILTFVLRLVATQAGARVRALDEQTASALRAG